VPVAVARDVQDVLAGEAPGGTSARPGPLTLLGLR